jgi:hypothetical protein
MPEVATAKAILARIRKGDLKREFSSREVWRPGWAMLTDSEQVADALAPAGGLRLADRDDAHRHRGTPGDDLHRQSEGVRVMGYLDRLKKHVSAECPPDPLPLLPKALLAPLAVATGHVFGKQVPAKVGADHHGGIRSGTI